MIPTMEWRVDREETTDGFAAYTVYRHHRVIAECFNGPNGWHTSIPPRQDVPAQVLEGLPAGARELLGRPARVAVSEPTLPGPFGPITSWLHDDLDPARQMTFYLGTHMPRWLEIPSMPPLFVAAPRLARYRSRGDDFPKAYAMWALDSGGFTELQMHGTWRDHPDIYGGMVTRLMEDCGRPVFAAPQDWMCEPWIISGGQVGPIRFAGTGLTVRDHQELTVANFCYLREQFDFVPWIPVLQGWTLDDYLRCADMYEAAGVDLAAEPLVGLGSVCRRQSTAEIGAIVSTFHARDYRLHGFGVKTEGLARYGHMLASADSMAWSQTARRDRVKLPGCTHPGWCANCPRWALQWRENVLATLRRPKQLDLFAA